MKNKAENLYLYLSEADDDLLREAGETDTREKLLSKEDPAKVPAPGKHRRFTVLKAISAVAACAAFTFLCVFLSQMLPAGEDTVPEPSPKAIRIDSLDALNYYGAKTLTALSATDPAKPTGSVPGDSAVEMTWKNEPDPLFASELAQKASDGSIQYDEEKGYYYYEFDPNDAFTISGARGFSILLSDPSGFLAQKLGTGLIDAVLTRNSFEDMITFRSQDGKYFSCLSGDTKEGYLQYLDSKYVDGFRVVKKGSEDGAPSSYLFSVRIENGIPVGFESSYYDGKTTGYEAPLDGVLFVTGSGYSVDREESFTVAELEELANNLRNSREDPADVIGKTFVYEKEGFSGVGDFTICIKDDGTFYYDEGPLCSIGGIGEWTIEGDTITLKNEMWTLNGTRTVTNIFRIEKGKLIWRAEGSDNFTYVKVNDGEAFLEK